MIGFCMTGSFCSFEKSISVLEKLTAQYEVLPVMSFNAYRLDNKFGLAADFRRRVEGLCGKPIVHTISDAEPIGPKKLLDALVIAPATGNTIAKLANGITDTSVTLACKAHLRNARPVLIAVSTNDALGAAAKNIGLLLNAKNIYFVPMRQDDPENKPNSIVADFRKIPDALESALKGEQIQPILM